MLGCPPIPVNCLIRGNFSPGRWYFRRDTQLKFLTYKSDISLSQMPLVAIRFGQS